MNLPPITSEQLMILVMAWEEGVPGNMAAPLVKLGLLHREPPYYRLTDTGRALLSQHALYKPFLVQSKEHDVWFDCGRTWTQTGAYGLMARLNAACPPRQYRILDEERRVIFTTEKPNQPKTEIDL